MSEQKPKSKVTPIALLVLLSMILGTCAWIFNEGSKSAKRADRIEASRQAKQQARLAEGSDNSLRTPQLCEHVRLEIYVHYVNSGWEANSLSRPPCSKINVSEDAGKLIVKTYYGTPLRKTIPVQFTLQADDADGFKTCEYVIDGDITAKANAC